MDSGGCGGSGRRDLDKYAYLKNPQISKMPGQKMIVVEVKGDPNVVGGDTFKALYGMFFRLKAQGKKMAAPRAMWPNLLNKPKNEWIGIYGLPVPDSVQRLPEQKDKSVPEVKIETWDYGEVAEILHTGSYGGETATIETLQKFIKDSGYKIAGYHEEEYLKGPGLFTKPSQYKTIIRYCVKSRKKK